MYLVATPAIDVPQYLSRYPTQAQLDELFSEGWNGVLAPFDINDLDGTTSSCDVYSPATEAINKIIPSPLHKFSETFKNYLDGRKA